MLRIAIVGKKFPPKSFSFDCEVGFATYIVARFLIFHAIDNENNFPKPMVTIKANMTTTSQDFDLMKYGVEISIATI